MNRRPSASHCHWSIASRTAAAILGGYGVIWLLTAALSMLLPAVFGVSPFDAVLGVTMASFLIWALIAMAVFHARSARRAWAWLLFASLLSMGILIVTTGRPLP